MRNEAELKTKNVAIACQDLDHSRTKYRAYSEADKYSALAAFDMYGANYHRTAIAYNVAVSTLRAWVKARAARGEAPSNLERERRGSLADKLESKVHDVVESITTEVIQKSTLSQRAVFIGILTDKLRLLRSDQLQPDYTAELCRLLRITPDQLPDSLKPGDEIPSGRGTIIDVVGKPVKTIETPAQGADARTTEEDRCRD